jgi:cytochrome c biogenesis protein CcmG/thiol:disulfide interchange protein DsbE
VLVPVRRFAYLLPVTLFLVLAGFFLRGLSLDPSEVPTALADKPMPEFDLPAVDDDTRGLATADLAGAVSFVNVFASWCLPCRAEHPLLTTLAEAGTVKLFGISYKDKPADARAWLDELGDPYERIGADLDGRIGIDLGVYGVPETFVIDRDGRIRYKHIGPITQRDLDKHLLPLIERLRQ